MRRSAAAVGYVMAASKLLVVESPNKVKDLRKYLEHFEPGTWDVVATVGHFRGLPPMAGQPFEEVASVGGGWDEQFVVHESKLDAVDRLAAKLKSKPEVFLASDDDREGEAISWHVAQHFGLRRFRRVRCHEITERGIVEAVKAAGELDLGLVDGQRARALLDYLIGMEVSRRLWPFGAKSAGRLQSAALRVVVERERRIQAFKPATFWRLLVRFTNGLVASVCVEEGPSEDELDENPNLDRNPKLVPKRFPDKAEAERFAAACRAAVMVVEKVEKKATLRQPPKPFTTADLLGTAASRLKMPSERTTKLAQGLFEKGLVTYIRTDSVALADDAIEMIRAAISAEYPTLLPNDARRAKNAEGAQAAHEAIRPTKMVKAPDAELDGDERALYELIYERALCSQMKPATIAKTVVTIAPGQERFRLVAQGSVITDPGWMTLAGKDTGDEAMLPNVEQGSRLQTQAVSLEEGKTHPPARFTEAALVRYLERRGIGRPSTYAAMLETLKARGYVRLEKSKFVPEALGVTADELVRLGFDELSREDFTVNTERALDAIAKGKLTRGQFLDAFYRKFQGLLAKAEGSFAEYLRAHPEALEKKDHDRKNDNRKASRGKTRRKRSGASSKSAEK
jgi:DNA topoisomerase-1